MKTNGLRIAILGPESTGKTRLAQNLAIFYKGDWVKEYAREYIEKLNREYTYSDVEHIAKWLLETYQSKKDEPKTFFFDTEMIITKIWFDVAFGRRPVEMDKWLKLMDFDAYLLCYYDLPWVPDPVRENGGEMRKVLFYKYKEEILKQEKPFAIIKGDGKERIKNAVTALHKMTNLPDWSETE
jgi:nicotinamide riboside kinase